MDEDAVTSVGFRLVFFLFAFSLLCTPVNPVSDKIELFHAASSAYDGVRYRVTRGRYRVRITWLFYLDRRMRRGGDGGRGEQQVLIATMHPRFKVFSCCTCA